MKGMKRTALLAAATAALLAGCSSDIDEMHVKIDEIKSRPGGRIEPLPEVKPYETFIAGRTQGRIQARPRLGRIIRYYYRAAA